VNNSYKTKIVVTVLVALAISTLFLYKVESGYVSGFSLVSGHVSHFEYNKSSSRTGASTANRIKTTVVSFKVKSKSYDVRSRGFQRPEFSESIEVYYDPNDPSNARVNRFDELYFYTLISLFFFIMSIFSALLTRFLTPYVRKLES